MSSIDDRVRPGGADSRRRRRASARCGRCAGRARARRARSRASRRSRRSPTRQRCGRCGSRAAAARPGRRAGRAVAAHRRQRARPLHRHGVALVVDDVRLGLLAKPRVLELDVRAHRPRVRVEDDDRPHLLLVRDRDLARDRLHRAVERERRDRRRVADLVARVVVGRLDRRAGERVVELVEEQQLPRLAQLLAAGTAARRATSATAPTSPRAAAGSRRDGSSA